MLYVIIILAVLIGLYLLGVIIADNLGISIFIAVIAAAVFFVILAIRKSKDKAQQRAWEEKELRERPEKERAQKAYEAMAAAKAEEWRKKLASVAPTGDYFIPSPNSGSGKGEWVTEYCAAKNENVCLYCIRARSSAPCYRKIRSFD